MTTDTEKRLADLVKRLRSAAKMAHEAHNRDCQEFRVDIGEYRVEDQLFWKAADAIDRLTAERDAAVKATWEKAAQKCRYYFKHQNYTGEWPPYEQGVEDTCSNLSNDFEQRALSPSTLNKPE